MLRALHGRIAIRIEHPVASTDRERQRRAEIALAIEGRQIDGRICGETCTIACTVCGASACQCMCSMQCPDMPRAISSDPDNHPIEPAVAPLVFAMTRVAAFQPCWSCEGHLGLDGKLWKVPRVWFYSETMVAVRLLTDGLGDLARTGKLQTSWRVSVTYSDPKNAETTFSLEPSRPFDEANGLAKLQEDMSIIAEALSATMHSQAQALHRETMGAAKRVH
jgi:hypothetical protein